MKKTIFLVLSLAMLMNGRNVKAEEMTEEIRNAYQEKIAEGIPLYCESQGRTLWADQFAVVDLDGDGIEEFLAYTLNKRWNDEYHWILFDWEAGNVIVVAEGKGEGEMAHADSRFEIFDGKYLCSGSEKCPGGYDIKNMMYLFYEDGVQNKLQYFYSFVRDFNSSGNEGNVVKDTYYLNGKEISKETGDRMVEEIEAGRVAFLGEVNEYTFQTDVIQNTEFLLPESSDRYLSAEEIVNMTPQELNYARNEIYARLGRGFQSEELRDYFNSKKWYEVRYSPEDFPDNILNTYEEYNVDLLYNREYEICPGGYPLY